MHDTGWMKTISDIVVKGIDVLPEPQHSQNPDSDSLLEAHYMYADIQLLSLSRECIECLRTIFLDAKCLSMEILLYGAMAPASRMS